MTFPEVEVFATAIREIVPNLRGRKANKGKSVGPWVVAGIQLVEDTPKHRKEASAGCAGCPYRAERYVLAKEKEGGDQKAVACSGFLLVEPRFVIGPPMFQADLSVAPPWNLEKEQEPICSRPPCGLKFSAVVANARAEEAATPTPAGVQGPDEDRF